MRDGVLRSLSTQRLAAVVVGVFSLAALLIAAAGLHGVLAFGVAQRRRELGIRLALGATAANVLRLVARDGLVLAVAGLGLGLLIAYGASGAIRGLLVDISPADPMTYAAVSGALAAVALLATYLPARRASRVDPIVALRADV